MAFEFFTPSKIFVSAILLRLILLLYGLFQDAYSPLKYTDIDYFVFTDAARYVSQGLSPYQRETYRYTPLLAWMLLPTTWPGIAWFSFGKVLFSLADIIAGWLILLMLRSPQGGSIPTPRALKLASIWLLNPMVATISTRGSSEGLLGVVVMALLWAVMHRRTALAGIFLGLSVHFKIYPFIYAPSIILYLETPTPRSQSSHPPSTLSHRLLTFLNPSRLTLTLTSLLTFTLLNALMYTLYGHPFLHQTYLHHLTRIDHRHNFSPYNTLLYLSSSTPATTTSFESLAFIPQLLFSAILLPLALLPSNRNKNKTLPSTLLAQTFAFVTWNKVCTSQYFLWYMIFLPFYIPHSTFIRKPVLGMVATALWVGSQALWLQQAFQLEFMGRSTFVPGLWVASLAFFAVNMWILGVVVGDVGLGGEEGGGERKVR
ncbi:GPI mannosyltransferase 1 [Loxospora ochrophaea]|nr:GPI mannosyltransferase 1 [Loxospora ochrophaea]